MKATNIRRLHSPPISSSCLQNKLKNKIKMDFVLLSCTKENLQLDIEYGLAFRLYSRPSPAPSWSHGCVRQSYSQCVHYSCRIDATRRRQRCTQQQRWRRHISKLLLSTTLFLEAAVTHCTSSFEIVPLRTHTSKPHYSTVTSVLTRPSLWSKVGVLWGSHAFDKNLCCKEILDLSNKVL